MKDVQSEWAEVVNKTSKGLFEKGFELTEVAVDGMAKYTVFILGQVRIEHLYFKGPIECNLRTEYGTIDLEHLCNYLNGKTKKYSSPPNYYSELGDASAEKYITYYNQIILNELDVLSRFLTGLKKEDYKAVITYSGKENMNAWREYEHSIKKLE